MFIVNGFLILMTAVMSLVLAVASLAGVGFLVALVEGSYPRRTGDLVLGWLCVTVLVLVVSAILGKVWS